MDPRVKASAHELQEQFDLSWRLYQLRLKLAPIGEKFEDLAQQLTKLKARAAERPERDARTRGLHSDTSRVWAAASAARRSTFVFRLGINDAAVRRRSGRRCCANSGDKGRRRGPRNQVGPINGCVAQIARVRSSCVESGIKASGFSGDKNGIAAGESLRQDCQGCWQNAVVALLSYALRVIWMVRVNTKSS